MINDISNIKIGNKLTILNTSFVPYSTFKVEVISKTKNKLYLKKLDEISEIMIIYEANNNLLRNEFNNNLNNHQIFISKDECDLYVRIEKLKNQIRNNISNFKTSDDCKLLQEINEMILKHESNKNL